MMFGHSILSFSRMLWLAVFLYHAISPVRANRDPDPLVSQTLENTLQALLNQKSQRIPFLESRSIKSLKEPMKSRGYLEFFPPDTLIKTVESPSPVTYPLSSREIRLTDGGTGESHSLRPDDIPELAYLGSSLTHLLTGDKEGLLSRWHVTVGGTNRRWRMTLIPREKDASGLRIVEIAGKEGVLVKLHVEALDGSISDLSLGIQ